jgi:hypothetical protein
MEEREIPGEDAAPVVADYLCTAGAEPVDERSHVGDERLDSVGADAARLLREPISTQVRRDGPKAGGGERGKLVVPRVREFRKAVKQDDEGPRSLLGPMKGDAVHGGFAVRERLHACPRLRSSRRAKSTAESSPNANIVPQSTLPPKRSRSSVPNAGPMNSARLNDIV